MRPDAGIAVVYFPLIPNPSAPGLPPASKSRPLAAAQSMQQSESEDPDKPKPSPNSIDPDVDDFLSTWNFVYTPEQIDSVVGLAKANFAEGQDQVRRVIRAVYERRKSDRLRRQEEEDRKRLEGFVPL